MKTFLGFALALSMSLPALAHADGDFEEKGVVVFEKIGAAIDANKDNCEKMGAAIDKTVDDNAATLKEVAAKSKGQTPAEKAAFDKKYSKRTDAAMAKFAGLEKCKGNKQVTAAFQKFAKLVGG